MLILGSASPRRRTLLSQLGVEFSVRTADVDEDVVTNPAPADNVLARARLKAAALVPQLMAERLTDGVVLTADTTVAIDKQILNKPADEAEARVMLELLGGRWHQVYTAMVASRFSHSAELLTAECVVKTDVEMRSYTSSEISSYIATGDPFDKTGGYSIQHPGFRPVKQISGCYMAVVGLPLCQVQQLLQQVTTAFDTAFQKIAEVSISNCHFCQQASTKFNF